LTPLYPFSAVVGLADLRLALLLNAVSPAIGGVLVRGEKGTAKSTVVRSLAGLLPQVEVVAGCRFGCDPASPYGACPDGPHSAGKTAGQGVIVRRARLIELPVGATEDRLVGALDLERALTAGQAAYSPGLLAGAHRGVLYVDEVNLLHDHLVDLLLDAAAMGEAYVERDGVSVRHAARFLLVGTMNPEEGELRPQLLDRFGLAVQVRAPREPKERVEVVRRRLAYEADPAGFAARWAEADAELAERIDTARRRLPTVELPDAELIRIAHVCAAFEVDGLRADLVVARAALALAAWHGRGRVTEQDVRDAARLALPHRRRRDPFDAPDLDEQALEDALNSAPPPAEPDGSHHGPGAPGDQDRAAGDEGAPKADLDGDADLDGEGPDGSGPDDGPDGGPDDDGPDDDGPDGGPRPGGPGGAAPDEGGTPPRPVPQGDTRQRDGADEGRHASAGQQHAEAARPRRARLFAVQGVGEGAAGRRSPAYTRMGRTVGARVPGGTLAALHLAATVRAAAGRQHARGRTPGGPLRLVAADLREPVRQGRESNLVLFCVDASGSMAARQRMGAVKGAVLSLLLDAYQRRDKVGLVTFRGSEAELALPPTSSVEAGAARLRELPTGGRTPLAAGLRRAAHTLRVERLRDPHRRALLVLVTDGRATAGPDPVGEAMRIAGGLAATGVSAVVVDCESGVVRLGLAARLAVRLGAEHVPLAEVTAQGLAGVARRDRRRAA
jgi:magnesium chelatase subunit D